MLKHSARRWLAGIGVAGALVAASAIPASAAPADDLDLYANNVILAPGGTEKWVSLFGLTTERLGDFTVKVDRSKVAAFADVQPFMEDDCTESGAILTCKVVDQDDDGSFLNIVDLMVRAKDGAEAGQEGALEFNVTDTEGGSGTFSSTVTIGEGVDLAASESLALKGAPGTTVKAPLQVENRGQKAANGAVLLVFGSYGLTPSKRYENCEYTSGEFDFHAFACTFDTTIAENATVRLDSSFGFTVPADNWAPNTDFGSAIWFTPADWEEFLSQADLGVEFGQKGTEGELKLESAAGAQRTPQTDVDPYNNETWIELQVTGDQKADVAAVGATVNGEVGSTAPMKVGYVNNGPAAVGTGAAEGMWVTTYVTLPKGVTAVSAPETCWDVDNDEVEPGKPGAAVYQCFLNGVLRKGEKAEFAFEVRIDKAGSQTGEVKLRTGHEELEIKDLNPANDTAKILVNAAGGGAGGGDGDDPTLPITGDSTTLVTVIGGLLLIAGAAGYVVTRRRKTRFVA
ncbi:LPXTG cell wall anchor domain-containing protein [Micromonospora sp. WMMC415]|nr:LPXTG cell wall anchor domain-containing protein [Micromonospora sp. WMMC415]QGN46020.1 LPXTG cell wall anchor domain-containing protein [Micromonospora sp. WMMC415]